MDGLVADLSRNIRSRAWRDDGILPSPSSVGPHYCFARRRPLTGQEELLCHGYPVWNLSFQTATDPQAVKVAADAMPVPTLGATLCAALAVVDFGSGRRLQVDPSHVATLVANAPPATGIAAGALKDIEKLPTEVAAADSGEAQFEGRAIALLNLVSHGSFGTDNESGVKEEKTVSKDEEAEATTQRKTILSALRGVVEDKEEPLDPDFMKKEMPGEPKDWPTRLRKLKVGLDVGWESAMRWTHQAAEDPDHEDAEKLIKFGISFLNRRFAQGVPDAAMRYNHMLVDSLKNTGLVSEAEKYDETVKSKWFSQNIDSGVSILSAQTDVQHYVSTVVANCTKNGWAMRRVFLDHLGTQVGHENKIAEFGFCEGWTPICDWLREAQVDHEVDWPSACTTLKALSKVAPAGVRGLLPVMHEVTRRIMNRPAISKAAESERLMASKVAEGLEERIVEAVAPALRTTNKPAVAILDSFVQGTGFIATQLRYTAALRNAAQNALVPLMQAQMKSKDWRRTMRQFSDVVDTDERQLSGVAWTRLGELERKFIKAIEAKLEERIKAAEKEELQEQQNEADHEDRAKHEVAKIAAEKVFEHLAEGNLKVNTEDGFKDFLVDFKEFRTKIGDCSKPPAAIAMQAVEAEAAAQRFCEHPGRCARARQWLGMHGLRHCATLLESHNVLHRISELGEAPDLLRGVGLPKGCRTALLEAASSGSLTEKDIIPCVVPPKWERTLSRSTGLQYFQEKRGDKQQWTWPVEPDPEEAPDEPAVPSPSTVKSAGPEPGRAVYVEHSLAGDFICLLCNTGGREHMKSKIHKAAVEQWRSLAGSLKKYRQELCLEEHSGSGRPPCAGFLTAWRGELSSLLRREKLPAVEQVFWHRVVLPALGELPENATIKEIIAKVHEMVGNCTAPEPNAKMKLPQAGVDFPVFPKGEELRLDTHEHEEALGLVDSAARLAEGITTTEGGQLHCGYCDTEVTNLAHHLNPYFKQAKEHAKHKTACSLALKWLRTEGWRLRREGIAISKRTCICGPCGWQGHWSEVQAHREHRKHDSSSSRGSSASTEEHEAWSAIFESADQMFPEAGPTLSGEKKLDPAKEELLAETPEERTKNEVATNAGQELLKKLSAGRLKRDSGNGLQELFSCIKALREAISKCKTPPSAARDALTAGEGAVRGYCERPARRLRARKWLHHQGYLHCAELLQGKELLERLHTLGTVPNLLNSGLPERCREALVSAASTGQVTEDDLAPEPDPPGWDRILSGSYGLHYFQESTGDPAKRRTQWDWPTQPEDFDLTEIAKPHRIGEPKDGKAVYVELDSNGEPHCLLCDEPGIEHLRGEAHALAVAHLTTFLESLKVVQAELARAVVPGKEPYITGLTSAWEGELKYHIGAMLAPEAVERVCWHRVVKPHLPVGGGHQKLLAAVAKMVEVLSAPEPDSFQPIKVTTPVPGEDFPHFPNPLEVTLKLTEQTPEVVYSVLSAEALLGEGIAPRKDGMWCGYCEILVDNVAKHLNPHTKAAKHHIKCRDMCLQYKDRLRKEGWILRHDGIRVEKNTFRCGLCSKSGEWYKLWEHRETKLHTRSRPPLPLEPTRAEREAWGNLLVDRKSTKDAGDKNESL